MAKSLVSPLRGFVEQRVTMWRVVRWTSGDLMTLPWLFAIFVAFGVSTSMSIVIALVIFSLGLTGSRLLVFLNPSISVSPEVVLGPGFVIGAAFWVFLSQILGGRLFVSFAILISLTVLPLLGKRFLLPTFVDSSPSTENLVGLALLAMASEWEILFPIGLLVTVLAVFVKTRRNSFAVLVSRAFILLVAIVAIRFGLSRTGEYWWVTTDDFSYLEAVRVHLANFGIWETFGPTNIGLYHWFSYGLVAQISQISFAGNWLILGKVSPVLFALVVVSSVIALVRFMMRSRRESESVWLSAGVMFVFLALRLDFASPSGVLAYAVSATTIFTVLSAMSKPGQWRAWGLVVLLAIVTSFTKVFYLPATVAVCLVLVVSTFTSNLANAKAIRFSIVGVLPIVYTVLLWWLGPFLDDGSVGAWQIKLQRATISESLLPVIANLFYIVSPSITAILVLAKKQPGENVKSTFALAAGAALAIALVSDTSITYGYSMNIDNTFFGIAIFYALLPVIVALADTRETFFTKSFLFIWSLTVFTLIDAVQETPAINEFREWVGALASFSAISSELANRSELLSMLVAVVGGTWVALGRRTNVGQWRSATTAFLILVVTSHLTVSSLHRVGVVYTDITSERYEASNGMSGILGSRDLVVTGEWIADNTEKSALIATNDLCEGLVTDTFDRGNSYCQWGTDYTLGVASARRFLILGPRFAYSNPSLRSRYVLLSRQFAESGTWAMAEQLRSLGVDYFVLREASTGRDDDFGFRELFKSGRYSVLDFRHLRN